MSTCPPDFNDESDNPKKKKLQNSLNFVWRSRPLSLNGRERLTKFSKFCNFFFDCHSDGKNLEAICSFGRDFNLKFQFLFLLKQSRF